ncbi:MAG: hypothetical protein ACTSUE_09000 [Promethearchaeota archaeon]
MAKAKTKTKTRKRSTTKPKDTRDSRDRGPAESLDRVGHAFITPSDLNFVHTLYHTAEIQSNVNLLTSVLFGKELSMAPRKQQGDRDGEERTVSDIVQAQNVLYYNPLIIEIYHHFNMFGFCPYILVPEPDMPAKADGTPYTVPKIPAFGTWKAELVINEEMETEVKCTAVHLEGGTLDYDSEIPIFTLTSTFSPSPQFAYGMDGRTARLFSLVASLVPSYNSLRNREELAASIAHRLAFPIVYYEHMEKESFGIDNIKSMQSKAAKILGDKEGLEWVESNMSQRIEKTYAKLDKQLQNISGPRTGQISTDATGLFGSRDFASEAIPSYIALPLNVKVVKDPAQPAPITDLPEYRRAHAEACSKRFGIPQSFTNGGTAATGAMSSGRQTASENDASILLRTVAPIKKDLVQALGKIWLGIYGDDACAFDLTLTPMVDIPTLLTLYGTKALNDQEFHERLHMAGATGIENCGCDSCSNTKSKPLHSQLERSGISRSAFGLEPPKEPKATTSQTKIKANGKIKPTPQKTKKQRMVDHVKVLDRHKKVGKR